MVALVFYFYLYSATMPRGRDSGGRLQRMLRRGDTVPRRQAQPGLGGTDLHGATSAPAGTAAKTLHHRQVYRIVSFSENASSESNRDTVKSFLYFLGCLCLNSKMANRRSVVGQSTFFLSAHSSESAYYQIPRSLNIDSIITMKI